jgi:hypothetical protein
LQSGFGDCPADLHDEGFIYSGEIGIHKNKAPVALHKDFIHTLQHDFVWDVDFRFNFWKTNLPKTLKHLIDANKEWHAKTLAILKTELPLVLSTIVIVYADNMASWV